MCTLLFAFEGFFSCAWKLAWCPRTSKPVELKVSLSQSPVQRPTSQLRSMPGSAACLQYAMWSQYLCLSLGGYSVATGHWVFYLLAFWTSMPVFQVLNAQRFCWCKVGSWNNRSTAWHCDCSIALVVQHWLFSEWRKLVAWIRPKLLA